MSWVYELLKNRYERKWYPPWKPSDYILWQFGPLRPKGYGEILFSDEYNYIIYTLYWSKVSKRFFFRGLYFPRITLPVLRLYVAIPKVVFKTFMVLQEARTAFKGIEAGLGARRPVHAAATSFAGVSVPAGATSPVQSVNTVYGANQITIKVFEFNVNTRVE